MNEQVELQLRRSLLRDWRAGDEPSLCRHANNRNVWRTLRDAFPHPYRLSDAEAWIRQAGSERPCRHFAIVVDGEAAGSIGLLLGVDVFSRSAEIGYWLGESLWGRGITTEAVAAVTRYAWSAFDLDRLHAGVFEGNAASARVLEKAGYTFEGRLRRAVQKDGRLLDQLVYAVVRTP